MKRMLAHLANLCRPLTRSLIATLISVAAVAALVTLVGSASKERREAASYSTAPKGSISASSSDQKPLSPLAPNVTATLTDNIAAAAKLAPGGTINYTAVITNTGVSPTDDATNLNFSAPLDANTTLTAGTIHASPLALNDTYNWVGNTFLDTAARALPAVTANDVAVNAPAGTDTFTLTTIAGGATSLGGSVSLAANGSFTYTPPLGRPNIADGASATDTFTYTITNSADGTLTSTGTVNIVLTGRVWYLQAGAAGDGRSGTPSGNPAAMSTNADKSSDIFYIFSNAGSLSGLLTVDAGQQLLGQGVNLVVTIPTLGSVTLFNSAAPTPTTTNGAGNCVTLAGAPGNNTLSGFNIGNCSLFGIQGVNVGTLAVSTLSINNTTGGGLDLTGVGTPAVSVVLGGLTSTGGSKNLNLVGLNGTVSLASGALSAASGNAFEVTGAGNAVISYSGTVTNTAAARLVNVAGKNGGSVSFSGALSGTGSSTGINLTGDAGATINFSGGISLSTGAAAAFTATGGGTVNATQNNSTILNTVTTTTGTGVNIATPTNIGGSGVTFRSITVNNGASNSATNGIILNGTTGAFMVAGDGSAGSTMCGGGINPTAGLLDCDGSGGTINKTTGASVLLTNAQNVTLRQMNITSSALDGVSSNGGGGITLSAIFINTPGAGAPGPGGDGFGTGNGWRAENITGTNVANNNTRVTNWQGSQSNAILLHQIGTNFTSFSLDESKIDTSATGAAGFHANLNAATSGTVNLINNEFTLIDQAAAQILNNGSGTVTSIVQKNNFHDADATGGDGNNTFFLALSGSGQNNFTIGGPNVGDGNTFKNLARLIVLAGVLQVDCAGNNTNGAKLNGSIQRNSISNDAGFVNGRRAIDVQIESDGPIAHGGHSVLIADNTVNNVDKQGINLLMVTTTGGDIQNNNFTIKNNTLTNVGTEGNVDSGSGIEIETNIDAANQSSNLSSNILVQNNSVQNSNTSAVGSTFEVNNRHTGGNNTSVMNLTVLGNTFTNSAAGETFEVLNSGGDGTGAGPSTCLDLNSGNTAPNNSVGGNGTGFKLTNNLGTYSIEGLGASTPSAFLGPKNQSNGASPATITTIGGFTNSAGCANSTAMLRVEEKQRDFALQLVKNERANAEAATPTLAQLTIPPAANQSTKSFAHSKYWISSKEERPLLMAKSTPKASPAEGGRIYQSHKPISHHAVRRNFNASAQQPNAPTSGETVSLNQITTFPAGKSITIKYAATLNTPPTTRQVSTQGTVSGSNFASVMTTDPGPPVVSGPTVTLIDTLVSWNGSTSTDWNTTSNWTVPGPGPAYAPGVSNPAVNDVAIPNVGAQPNISATDITIYSLNISNGRTLTITNPRILTIGGSPGGDLTLDGIISGGFLNLGTGTHVITNAGGAGNLSSNNVATLLSGSTTTLNNNLQAGALAVNAGGSMNITNRTLSLNGSGAALVAPGGATFTTTGSTVIFNGTAAQTAAGVAYNNLTINNTIGTNITGVTLTGNATVNGVLALTSSDLDTGAFVLTQPNTTASTGVSDVVGSVKRTGGPFALSTVLTFGNPNNQITFTAGATRPTDVTMLMAKTAPATYAAAVQRNYTLSQTGGAGFTATLRLHYLDSELNGNTPETSLNLRRLTTGLWKAQVPTVVDAANNWVESNAVLDANFSTQWTFSALAPSASNGVVVGRVTNSNGMPVEGAVVRLSGTQSRKTITDANGNYQFDNVETNGFYTVTPSRVNYNFTPLNRAFSQIAERTEAVFTAISTGDAANPLDTAEYFVRQQYVDVLGREPDEGGFNYWSDRILECGTDVLCVNHHRRDVAAAFFIEQEFQQTGSFIYDVYKGALGRRPGFTEYTTDRQQVIGGANLDAEKTAFTQAFVQRGEFLQRYQSSTTGGLFVDALIANVLQNSGVDLSAARDALVTRYNTGANQVESRALVLRDVVETSALAQAEYNPAFVLTEYFAYLRRDPEAGGYAYWLDVLNNHEAGNFRGMVCAFINSAEYQRRFSAVVSRSDRDCGQ